MSNTCEHGHLKRVWLWRAFWLPSTPPQPLTGWWAVCSRCGLSHEYDAGNVTRKWWQLFRWYKPRPKG